VYLARNVASLQAKLTGRLNFMEAFLDPMNLPSRFSPRIEGSLFAGLGDLSEGVEDLGFADSRSEAGFGISFRLPSGSGISLDFPLYLSDPVQDEDQWAWRTVLGFYLKKF
jgi:hypothetical protein